MRSATTLIGVALLALAMLNLNIVEGIGVGLVRDVEEKYRELGADWILVQYNAWWSAPSLFDPEAFAREAAEDADVRRALAFWYAGDFHLGASDEPMRVILSGAGHAFEEDPHILLPLDGGGGQAQRVKFAREPLSLVEGRWPAAPGEIALDTDAAALTGIGAGAVLPFRHQPTGATITESGVTRGYTGDPIPFGDATVTGVVRREKLGNDEENHPIVLAAHDPRIVEAIQADRLGSRVVGSFAALRVDLHDVATVVPRVQARLEARGLTAEVWEPSWLADEKNPQKLDGARTAQPGAPKQASILTDHDLVQEASEAAARAGRWYRFLAAGALLLAALGVAFTATAALRRTRLDTGVRQALGFTRGRLYARCVARSAALGASGGALGGAAAAFFASAGLSERLLGVPLGVDLPRFLLLGALVGALLHILAALPVQAWVLRAAPAKNLRDAAQ